MGSILRAGGYIVDGSGASISGCRPCRREHTGALPAVAMGGLV